MPESTPPSSSWGTVWTYVKRHWHWLVLLGIGIYAYRQYMPSIDFSTVEEKARDIVAQTLDGNTFWLREHRGRSCRAPT